MNEELSEFLQIVATRGMQIDLAEGFAFKRHEKNPEAPKAPFKINLCTQEMRPDGRLSDDDMARIGDFLQETIRERKLIVPAIAGVPRVGEAIARSLQVSVRYHQGQYLPLITLQKIESGDGRRAIGPVTDHAEHEPGKVVLPIDDVANHGNSKLEMVRSLRDEGYIVNDFLVFLDYEQGAREALQHIGVELHTVATLQDVLSVATRRQLIGTLPLSAIHSYLESAAA